MRIVSTRPAERSSDLLARLRARGHEATAVPLTAIRDRDPFPDPAGFDGVLFTSASAVARAPRDVRWPRVGAVGTATAAALEARGVRVDVVGTGGGAELATAWGPARGRRLLLPQAADAHPALAAALRAAGAEVAVAAVYETVPVEPDAAGRAALARADVLLFFAPSAVRAFAALEVSTRAHWWAVGPTTAAAVRAAGGTPLEGDLDALEDLR